MNYKIEPKYQKKYGTIMTEDEVILWALSFVKAYSNRSRADMRAAYKNLPCCIQAFVPLIIKKMYHI